MAIVICPGFHDVALTQGFLQDLSLDSSAVVVFPTNQYPAYSPWHLIQFLEALPDWERRESPMVFIGFSAGVVAAIATAQYWQAMGRSVNALIAVDGWGVPLYGPFPIHRISHDYFTHWSSSMAEPLGDCFYADPPVEHLNVWRSPASTQGRWVNYMPEGFSSSYKTNYVTKPSLFRSLCTKSTAAEFLTALLHRYGE